MSDNKDPEKTIYPCRVCGLDQEYDAWNPTLYDICDCCRTEFGLHDTSLEQVRKIRMHWLTTGAKRGYLKNPSNWHTIEDLTSQLKNIPHEWW